MKKRKGESEEEFKIRVERVKEKIKHIWDKREKTWGTVSIAKVGIRRR